MKLLLSVGAILLALVFSTYAEPPSHAALMPNLYKCFDLLRLESLQPNPQDQSFRINANDNNQMELLHRYFEVVGWLRGFFTEVNIIRSLNGGTPDVTKGTTQKEWLPWIYSYCRAHPSENLENAAEQLGKALSSSATKPLEPQ